VNNLLRTLFFDEPAGVFAEGQVLTRETASSFDESKLDRDVGFWKCDLFDESRLTWSEKVYEIFGFPSTAPVARHEAVERYAKGSREVLERVRTFALTQKLGFLLDAEITCREGRTRSIRILAVPVFEQGRMVGLRGAKRLL